jgi:hypothetical protein
MHQKQLFSTDAALTPNAAGKTSTIMKTLLTLALALGLMTSSALADAPKTVIHFITVAFKADATPEQIQAVLDGAQKLPSEYKGILHVWTKSIKVQNIAEAKVKKTNVIAMEFADEAALKAYADSDAQKKWYELYLPIREQSTTFDVGN